MALKWHHNLEHLINCNIIEFTFENYFDNNTLK